MGIRRSKKVDIERGKEMGKININPRTTNVKIDKVWAALAEYGIHSEADLDEAMKHFKPINIGCMVSPVKIDQPSTSEEME